MANPGPNSVTSSTEIQTPETSDGYTIGNDATALVAFHGATPVDQAAAITSPADTGATNSSPYGFTTAAQADAIVTSVRAILAALREKGLIAT